MAEDSVVSISVVLDRLSNHLDMLAGKVLATEEAVGKALQGDKAPLENAVGRLQTLDFLRQSLEDCAMLSLMLATHKNGDNSAVSIEQLEQRLKLEATKNLLVTRVSKPLQGGDVQLF